MGIARSTCYDAPKRAADDTALVEAMHAIKDEFEAYGWRVIRDVDGHDGDAVRQALDDALSQSELPTLVCCKTTIGYGAPHKQGSAAVHGSPLGAEEVAAAREQLGWKHGPFEIPIELFFSERTWPQSVWIRSRVAGIYP